MTIAESPRSLPRGRPTLSVSIVTRNSASRLSVVIAQARRFADEVVVGVDADSTDATWQEACRYADTVYLFRHPGQLAPAHLLAVRQCRGDWILRLDDDEFMEAGFEEAVPRLLGSTLFTHYCLPRKWVVSLDPPTYVHGFPWFPDFQLRLFRNDPSAVWKPPRYHTGYCMAGPRGIECRHAILHFEPVWCSPEQRERKLRAYGDDGGTVCRAMFGEKSGEMRSLDLPVAPPPRVSPGPRVDPEVKVLVREERPPWGCRIEAVDLPRTIGPAERVPVKLELVNTGKMAWYPAFTHWPILTVSHHLRSVDGAIVQFDGDRIPIEQHVPPGLGVTVTGTITAPSLPGRYVLAWDMVSEGECWFQECGGSTFDVAIVVTPARPAEGEAGAAVATAPGSPLDPQDRKVRVQAELPCTLESGQISWIDATFENLGSSLLESRPPHPVHLSYEWMDPVTGSKLPGIEGLRSPLAQPLTPRTPTAVTLPVEPPEAPGEYLLRLTAVQEAVAWFDGGGEEDAACGTVHVRRSLPPRPLGAGCRSTVSAHADPPGAGPVSSVSLRWVMTSLCNYACSYCSQRHALALVDGRYNHAFRNHPVGDWLAAFSRHFASRRLSLSLTGGEPMLDRDAIVPLLNGLTALDAVERVTIDTNAYWEPAQFRSLDRSKLVLKCGFHPEQTDEEEFFDRLARIVSAGFEVGAVIFVFSGDRIDEFLRCRERVGRLGICVRASPDVCRPLGCGGLDLPRRGALAPRLRAQGRAPFARRASMPVPVSGIRHGPGRKGLGLVLPIDRARFPRRRPPAAAPGSRDLPCRELPLPGPVLAPGAV